MAIDSSKDNPHQPTLGHIPYLVVGRIGSSASIEVGRRYDLSKEQYLLSNESDADIQIPGQRKPTYQIRLFRKQTTWFFENLAESGEIYLNRFPNREGALRDGDFLQVGDTVYQFLAGVGIQSDIFEAMHQAIRIDAHTKAYNKAHFWESFPQWIALIQRNKQPLSLVILDIDHFKKLNTTYGHLIADDVLRQFSHRIRSRLRRGDTFFRVGGEEFAIALPETANDQAMKLAEDLRIEIEKQPFLIQQYEISITASLGVSTYRRNMKAETLYEKADECVRKAKALGRNQVVG